MLKALLAVPLLAHTVSTPADPSAREKVVHRSKTTERIDPRRFVTCLPGTPAQPYLPDTARLTLQMPDDLWRAGFHSDVRTLGAAAPGEASCEPFNKLFDAAPTEGLRLKLKRTLVRRRHVTYGNACLERYHETVTGRIKGVDLEFVGRATFVVGIVERDLCPEWTPPARK